MKAKMIADFRRKPSRARQEAARKEHDAYVDRELAKIASIRFGMDYGFGDAAVVAIDPGVPIGVAVAPAPPKSKEPLPMLKQPEREVTTLRGGKWAKPEKEPRRRR